MAKSEDSASTGASSRASTRPNAYRLRPRRRWLLRATAYMLLLVVAGHVGWNVHARRSLSESVESARRLGEPMSPADFFPAPTVADADNAALDLAAFRTMQPYFPPHEAWERLGQLESPYDDDRRLSPPLSQDQLNCLRELVRLERCALRHVDDACDKPALQWPLEPPRITEFLQSDDVSQHAESRSCCALRP